MKPSITIQSVSGDLSSHLNAIKSHYNFIERVDIVTDNQEFSLQHISSNYTPLRFTCTIDKFFSSAFLKFFKTQQISVKSLAPFSDLSGISMTLNEAGEMLLTLSKSLDEASGLDASKQLVDSAHFDSSTRLLCFNLHELAGQTKRLERIQRNCLSALSRPEYACHFMTLVLNTSASQIIESFDKLMGIKASIDDTLRPKLIEKHLNYSIPWPLKDEFELKDNNPELLDLFDWIGSTLRCHKTEAFNEPDYFKTENCKYLSLEGTLLPPLFDTLTTLSASSTRLIASLKCCKNIPPPFELNLQRLQHFNERKFDATACTADQMALCLFKSPTQTLSFRLNSTA